MGRNNFWRNILNFYRSAQSGCISSILYCCIMNSLSGRKHRLKIIDMLLQKQFQPILSTDGTIWFGTRGKWAFCARGAESAWPREGRENPKLGLKRSEVEIAISSGRKYLKKPLNLRDIFQIFHLLQTFSSWNCAEKNLHKEFDPIVVRKEGGRL